MLFYMRQMNRVNICNDFSVLTTPLALLLPYFWIAVPSYLVIKVTKTDSADNMYSSPRP